MIHMDIKTIAVDMDDVLVDLIGAWTNYLNKHHSLQVSIEDIKEWDMKKAFPTLTNEQIYEPLHIADFYKTIKPFECAMEYLKKLKEEGFEIRVVTATFYKCAESKLDNALFPYFDFISSKEVILCYDKHLIRADILFDDYYKNLERFKGIRVLKDMPYNKDAPNSSYDFRVTNFKDFYNRIHMLQSVDKKEFADIDSYSF